MKRASLVPVEASVASRVLFSVDHARVRSSVRATTRIVAVVLILVFLL